MKRKIGIKALIAMAMIVGFSFASCDFPSPENVIPDYRTVTFDAADGEMDAQVWQVRPDGTVERPPNPTRAGFDFIGWFEAEDGGELFDFDAPIAANVTIHARWEESRFTVSFNTHGGSDRVAQRVLPGGAAEKPSDPTMDGNVFSGWYDAEDGGNLFDFDKPILENVTVHAQWELFRFTVSFRTHGGSVVPDQRVTIGSAAQRPQNPTSDYYRFAGWFTEPTGGAAFDFQTRIFANVTLHAQWELSYLITASFNTHGGSAVASQQIEAGDTAQRPSDPTRGGHRFIGWFTEPAGGAAFDFETQIRQNVTLHAQWEQTEFAVSFNTHGGSAVDMQYVPPGGTARKPADPRRDRHDFAGWFTAQTGGTAYNFGAQISQNVTVHARWTAHVFHTITYRDTGRPDVKVEVRKGATVLSADPFPRSGAIFRGWYSNEALAGNPHTSHTPINADLVLYSAWHQTEWMYVSSGHDHTVAIGRDGTLWAWGGNRYGQLGVGNNTNYSAPQRVGAYSDWVAVSAGNNHTLAIRQTSSGARELYSWGLNDNGRLGHGHVRDLSVPTRVGNGTNWVTVSAGSSHSLGIRGRTSGGFIAEGIFVNASQTPGGELWGWGWNIDGQLGFGHRGDSHVPQRVGLHGDWVAISAGADHSLAMRRVGNNDHWLYGMGRNRWGQVGNGTWDNTAHRDKSIWVPTRVKNDARDSAAHGPWMMISAGQEHNLAIRSHSNGKRTLWVWGRDFNGRLGIYAGDSDTTYPRQGYYDDWQWVSAGNLVSVGIRGSSNPGGSRTLWSWGKGAGNSWLEGTHEQVGTSNDWVMVSTGRWHDTIIGIRRSSGANNAGTVWGWGQNHSGELGNGTTERSPRSRLTQAQNRLAR
ncbi:MAG: InlB B-repeat-containing protein [Treponema sp.]|nr:InlB B-repeat-containing protein [Treponema sp.]